MSIYFIPAVAYFLMAIVYALLATFALKKQQPVYAAAYAACSAIHGALSSYYWYGVLAAELTSRTVG